MELGAGGDDLSARGKGKLLQLGVLVIVCWVVWRECNARIFENAATDLNKLPDVALSLFLFVGVPYSSF